MNQRKAGALLSYGLTIVNVVVGLLYIPLLIFYLGKSDYGLYQLMGSFLIYLGLFDFGLTNTVTRYYSKFIALKDEKSKENLLALSTIIYFCLTLLLTIVGWIIYLNLDNIFNSSLDNTEMVAAKNMYIVILITVAITISTSVFNSVINAHEKFIFLRLLSILQTILRPIIILAIFTIEANAFIVVLIQAIIIILSIIVKIYYSYRKLKVKIVFHNWDFPLVKDMLGYSFFIFLTVVMDQIFWRSDQLIIGIILGTAAVGVYSIASQLIMYFMTLSLGMSGVFLPNITKRVTDNATNKELTEIFIRIGRLQFIILGAVLMGFILLGRDFILLWLDSSFMNAYYITIIIMLPFTIDLIQNIGLTILQAKNMYSFRAIIFIGMAFSNVIISIPLIINYGGIGAAIATGVCYFIGNGVIMNIYYYKKVGLNIFRFWYEIFRLAIPMIAVFLMGNLLGLFNLENHIYDFIFKGLLFLCLYILLLWNFGMNKYEKNLIIQPFKRVCDKYCKIFV